MLLRGLFSSCGEQGLLSSCGKQASHCGGFSCCGAQALVAAAHGLSSCSFQALEHRFSGGGSWVYLLCSMWDLSESWIEPVSPALADGFFTIELPGKP